MMRETGTDDDAQVADAQVPNRPDSVQAARAFLIRLLDGWGITDEVIDDAALLTSELLSNAVEHGSGEIELRIEVSDGLLHVGVRDEADGVPEVNQADSGSDGGRGMWIVQSVAHDWGSAPSDEDTGKTVWFELSVGQGADD
jgi:anti-sigma regulatory factor (Ser/Thr protein kinase)